MSEKRYLDEIAAILEAILEQTETISERKGKIPQIELDIVQENIRKLYDAFRHLDKANASAAPAAVPTSVATPAPSMPSEEPAVTPQVAPRAETGPDRTVPAEDARPEGPQPAEPETSPERPHYTIPKRPADIPASHQGPDLRENGTKKVSVAEMYGTQTRTLNDLAENGEHLSVAERLQQHRITDLRAALGINDKFVFINDLFEGDSERYNASIETLNSFKNYEEAFVHLIQLQQRYGWDTESSVYHKLTDFIRRRYL